LQAGDGSIVRVLNPGRANAGAGPDFRNAVLELAGERLLGDVELHLRASYFRAHGHCRDHAYDRLALHVVYLADEGPTTLLANGRLAPVASFAPWLQGRAQELAGWLAAPALWLDPCHDAIARLGADGVASVLQSAGRQRFEAKVERLQASIEAVGEQEALWQALLAALGQGGDRDGFVRLALLFPCSLARLLGRAAGSQAEAWLRDALLAVSGLGDAPPQIAALLPRPLQPPLQRSGRPLNWPDRRLAALASLFHRAGEDLAGYIAGSVAAVTSARDLVAAWRVADPAGGPALLGPDRAQELVVNVALPFAATRAELRGHAFVLLAQLKASSSYAKTAFLEANLGLSGSGRRSVLQQQGLVAFVEQWCKQGGCGLCGLSPGVTG
jgi:hypothetical protein